MDFQELRDKIKSAWTSVSSAPVISNAYDGDGLRVKKNEYSAVTYYLRSSVLGGQVVAEINSSGDWQRGYVYSGSDLLAVQDSGVFWMHENPVTKSKRVTDVNGNVVSAIELDPWGADTNASWAQAFQPKKYTSYSRDANGGDEAMFRRYNRKHARFDQPDPYDGSYDLANPQTLNRYAYVQNDPANLVDPTGSEPILCGYGGVDLVDPIYCTNGVPHYLSVLRSRFGGLGEPKMGGGGPQNTDIISLHNTAHSNYSSCTSILTNSPAAKLKGDVALHFVDEATALSVLDTSALEGVDATLIAAMWAAESSFSLNPSNHYRVGDGGEDIGPMQLANTVWNKSPYIDNLGDVFGTNQSRGGTFNGNPYANLRAGARAINDAGGSRANKAGVFRAGASWAKTNQGIAAYNSRVSQFNAWAKTYDDFFNCLRRK